MKKITLLLLTLMVFGFSGWGQVFMTELADPNNNSNARFIELYNIGASDVDFTEGSGWKINKYTNGSTTVSQSINLTGTILAGDFYIIAYDLTSGTFQSVYGFAPDQLDAVSNGVAGANGDDTFELIDGTGAVVDFYGVQPHADLSSTVWEYEDGRAERAAGATSGENPPADADWNTWSDGPGGDVVQTQDAPDDFDPAEWIGTASGPTISVSPSSLSGFSYLVGNGPSAEQSFTVEGTDLTADITITPPTNYEISTGTGGSFVATNPVTLTQSGGTVSSTLIYTRLKVGLAAGDYNNEVITASSTDATDKTVTCNGAVEAPATTTLPYNETFDTDLGDCYTYSVSGAGNEWGWNSGAYAQMNGFGGANPEEDWLILPGIDFSIYSNVFMNFETQWKYGNDDANNYLKLYYSTDYSGTGDPTSSTWNPLTYTAPGTADSWVSSGDIDLSGITNSSVYIGFKYYSTDSPRRWDIDNINIQEPTSDPEPTNYPTVFAATTNSAFAITTSWIDAIGAQLPAGYLILADMDGTFTAPSDGTTVTDDSDMSDGEGAINITYGVETYQWTGLTPDETYYFIIYPYTNSGSTIDYKTDETPPEDNETTDDVNLGLYISEVADPSGTGSHDYRFVELVNGSATAIDLSTEVWYLNKQTNGGSWGEVQLSGAAPINPGEVFVIAVNGTTFTTEYGFAPDQSDGIVSSNGDDGYYLTVGGDYDNDGASIVDAYGVVGQDGTDTDWEFEDSKGVRLRSVSSPNATWTASEWDVPSSARRDDMTPSEHKEDITWAGAGTTADDWNEKGGNWSGTYGYIPDASFNVTVPSTTVSPVIYSQAACNELTVQAGGSLDVSVNEALTAYGSLDVISGGAFTVLSDATGNGSFIGKWLVFGDVTIERYIAGYTTGGNDGWHQIASPIDMMTIAGSDLEPGTSTPNLDDLYEWNEQSELWNNYKPAGTSFTEFKGGQGYLVAYETSSTKHFTGQLSGWDFDATNLPYTPAKGNGWNFLGNPYPSAIEWDATSPDWQLSNIGGVAEIWNESAGNYAMINNGDVIPSTNGFFVQATSATNFISIPEEARVHNNSTNNYKSGNDEEMEETLVLNVTNDENTYFDVNRIGFKPDATEAWDIAFDAHKLFGSETAPQLWTISNNENFAQNYLPHSAEEYPVSLNFRAGVNGTYHINADGLNSFYQGTDIFLEDVLMDKIIDLNEQQMYTFTASTDDDETRFVLHFYGVTSTGETPASDDAKIYAYQNTVYIQFTELPSSVYDVEVINMVGQQVYANEFAPGGLNSIKLNEKPGIYFVRLRTENKTMVQKVMISK